MYGYPVILQTDNGSEFNNAELKEYCRSRYIQYRTSRAYKPNTQGQVERVHRTLKGAIRQDMELVNNTTDWVKYYEDYVQAYKWFSLAAMYGVDDARVALFYCVDRLSDAEVAEAQRLALEWHPQE